ncbi:hypothetical protein ILYODFUR_037662 [Ilyodon furcidens]|uniref:Chemokine interleukin-8-like domain-containing protein n=1 Tax=Ilyodon furcidens TaxID=33524 RepID=A0ABV0U1F5_9TELE
MSFSGNCVVIITCATLLLVLHVQGHQKYRTSDQSVNKGVRPSCCVESSSAYIREPVKACFIQRPNLFNICKIHAYIFITVSNKTYCVDPSATWLPDRLKKLAVKGITCKQL